MISVREQVLAALLTALQGTGTTVKRLIRIREGVGALPLIALMDGEEEVEAREAGRETHVMSARVHLEAKADSPDGMGPAIATLAEAVRTAVRADRTLGGVARNVRVLGIEEPEPLEDTGADLIATGAVELEVLYATRANDPYTQA